MTDPQQSAADPHGFTPSDTFIFQYETKVKLMEVNSLNLVMKMIPDVLQLWFFYS